MFGGLTVGTPGTQQMWYNDMYAADLTSLITGQPSQMAGWNLVSPAPGPNGLVAGFPDPRMGATWTGYTVGAILFGGLGTTDGSTAIWPACFYGTPTAPAPSNCFFHSHVWAFLPGSVDWSVPAAGSTTATPYTAASWVRLNNQGFNGGPVPSGRAEHVAGSLGDNLYIFGGFNAQGPVQPSDSLWVYHLITQSWSQIQFSQPAPPMGQYTGAFIANHFYMYVEQPNLPAGSGQLWRWAPTFQWNFPVAPPAAAPISLTGPNAGIVILILIGEFPFLPSLFFSLFSVRVVYPTRLLFAALSLTHTHTLHPPPPLLFPPPNSPRQCLLPHQDCRWQWRGAAAHLPHGLPALLPGGQEQPPHCLQRGLLQPSG